MNYPTYDAAPKTETVEYKTLHKRIYSNNSSLDNELNELAADGWVIIAVVSPQEGYALYTLERSAR